MVFSMYLLGWLMVLADVTAEPVGTFAYAFKPDGPAAQSGPPTLGCFLTLISITWILVRAHRPQHGRGGMSARRVLLGVWTSVVTLLGGGWVILFVVFTAKDAASDVPAVGLVDAFVGPSLVALVILAVVAISWRLLLSPDSATAPGTIADRVPGHRRSGYHG